MVGPPHGGCTICELCGGCTNHMMVDCMVAVSCSGYCVYPVGSPCRRYTLWWLPEVGNVSTPSSTGTGSRWHEGSNKATFLESFKTMLEYLGCVPLG